MQCLQSPYTTTVIGRKGSHLPSRLRVAGSIPARPTTFLTVPPSCATPIWASLPVCAACGLPSGEVASIVILNVTVSCLSWKWRKRSSVKITERTHEETRETLHAGREGRHSEEAFGGRSADLGPVRRVGTPANRVLPLAEGVLRERSRRFPAARTEEPSARTGTDCVSGKEGPDEG